MIKHEKQLTLHNDVVLLKKEVLSFIQKNSDNWTKQDFEAHYFLLKNLDEFILILSKSCLPEKSERFAILSSMVIELPKYVLDPKLGGKIIELEKKYLQL